MSTDRIKVLVTAIGGGGHGEQILKALRLADGERYFIVGADAQSRCPQFDWVDERMVLPMANDHSYIDVVLDACKRLGVSALFHGCEPELLQMSKARDRIRAQGIFLPINPASLIDICMNKERTNGFLSEMGFTPPRYIRPKAPEDLEAIDWYPVVVKPAVGGGGSANCYIAQDVRELRALADYIGFDAVSATFVVQEYVGTPQEEYTVGVLHDMDGNFINSIAVRRFLIGGLNIRVSVPNRTGRKELGPRLVISSGVSHGSVARYPEVTRQCEQIAVALGARGPINIQCRLVDGVVKVFEINPRFSGTTSLRAMMGYNEPDVLIRRHLLGENVAQRFPYQEGTILRGLTEYRIDDSRPALRWVTE